MQGNALIGDKCCPKFSIQNNGVKHADSRLVTSATATTTRMSSTFSNTSRLRAQSNLSDLDPRLRDSTASDQLQLQHGQYPQNGSPHQNIHHFAPPSAGNTPDHDTADGMHDGNSGDPKRPRACEGASLLSTLILWLTKKSMPRPESALRIRHCRQRWPLQKMQKGQPTMRSDCS